MTYNIPRQTLNFTFRLILLCLNIFLLAWVLYNSEKYALSLILFFAILVQFKSLLDKLTATDREIINFLDSIRFSDFSQKLGRKSLSKNHSELARAFDHIMEKFKEDRAREEKENRYFHALIDHIPVALLTIQENQEAQLLNKSAQNLFGLSHINHISDLKAYGPDLTKELEHLTTNKKRLIHFNQDSEDIKLSLATTKIITDGNVRYLVSLQNIQSELDSTQSKAWQDLVHVLTHELMNSLTPVASLSNSMNILMADIEEKQDDETVSPEFSDMLHDLRDGISAISRRSRRLDSFVENYRKMTKLPPPETQRLAAQNIFDNMDMLFRQECKTHDITLTTDVTPSSLSLNADPELIDQALINLIKNAIEIGIDQKDFKISLKAYLDRKGHSVLEISDNGPGIEPKILQRIFVPFFTTKQQGSGIGLSLTRQVMLAHKGSIRCHNNSNGGASFRLVFKS